MPERVLRPLRSNILRPSTWIWGLGRSSVVNRPLPDNNNVWWCREIAAEINQPAEGENERDWSMVDRQCYPADGGRLNTSYAA